MKDCVCWRVTKLYVEEVRVYLVERTKVLCTLAKAWLAMAFAKHVWRSCCKTNQNGLHQQATLPMALAATCKCFGGRCCAPKQTTLNNVDLTGPRQQCSTKSVLDLSCKCSERSTNRPKARKVLHECFQSVAPGACWILHESFQSVAPRACLMLQT